MMPNLKQCLRAIGFALIAATLAAPTTKAETPAEFVATAFKNAEAATRKRTELTYRVDNASYRHTITKVAPDRLQVVMMPATGAAQEVIVIGDTYYAKEKGSWIESKAARQSGGIGTVDAFAYLQKIFADLGERERQVLNGREQRVFAGRAKWQAGASHNEGSVEVLVDRRTSLPTRSIFNGRCGARTCTFTQTMDFSANLSVEAPKPLLRPNTIQLYAALDRDRLAWLEHNNALTGSGLLRSPLVINRDFSTRYRTIIASIGSPVIYAMEPNGDLYWYRHIGFREGPDRWLGPIKVGIGWTMFDKIIAGENGVIYGRLPNGDLRWQKHLGHDDGTVSWTNPVVVGTGWHGFIDIFAGSGGVLYGIKPDGDLIWHRHLGHQAGSVTWVEPSRKVGNGWQSMKAIVSVGSGVIYAIKPNGDLGWYRHHGHASGEDRSADSIKIDGGWTAFRHFFALRVDD